MNLAAATGATFSVAHITLTAVITAALAFAGPDGRPSRQGEPGCGSSSWPAKRR